MCTSTTLNMSLSANVNWLQWIRLVLNVYTKIKLLPCYFVKFFLDFNTPTTRQFFIFTICLSGFHFIRLLFTAWNMIISIHLLIFHWKTIKSIIPSTVFLHFFQKMYKFSQFYSRNRIISRELCSFKINIFFQKYIPLLEELLKTIIRIF